MVIIHEENVTSSTALEPLREKACFWVSDQFRHTMGCIQSQKMVGFIEKMDSIFICSEINDADQIRAYRAADLRFVSTYAKKQVFS